MLFNSDIDISIRIGFGLILLGFVVVGTLCIYLLQRLNHVDDREELMEQIVDMLFGIMATYFDIDDYDEQSMDE